MKGPVFNFIFAVYSVLMIYTIAGMQIWGGKVTVGLFDDIAALNPDSDVSDTYMWLNFNDFWSGIMTLFTMMLFNNWQFIWQQFNFAIDGRDTVTNAYFISFLFIVVYIMMNIIMALIIDVYTSIEDSVSKEKLEKQALIAFGEQAIRYEEAKAEEARLASIKNFGGSITGGILGGIKGVGGGIMAVGSGVVNVGKGAGNLVGKMGTSVASVGRKSLRLNADDAAGLQDELVA